MKPSKLTEQRVEAIAKATELGATRELAARYAGVSRRTLQKWLAKGREGASPLHIELLERVEQAEGRLAVGLLEHIEKAAKSGTWQAAAWKLERLMPHVFGRTEARPHKEPSRDADSLTPPEAFATSTPREQDDALSKAFGW